MPVSFRCLKRVSVCWVMGFSSLVEALGAADVLVLLRQFWITERTCGQLVAATGQHRLELRLSRTSPSRLASWQQPSTRDGGCPAKTQQSQAESVCLLGMGFLCQRSLTQHKVRSDVGSPLLKTPWRPALLLAVTFRRNVLRECAHPGMVLRGWLATSCCW